MLQPLCLPTIPTIDIQQQATREVARNYRILLVRDRVEEYLKHTPRHPEGHSIQLTQLVCRIFLVGFYALSCCV